MTNPDPMENESGSVASSLDQGLVNDPNDVSGGKHLLLMVPDFTGAQDAGGDGTTALSSYLRLGMAHSQAGDASRADLGEDLASLAKGFTDDMRDRGTASADPNSEAPLTAVAPAGFAPPEGSADQYRVNESARLHSKGGWRDHSDGNRITTTRGDKIEIIRGNYKLMVLGRRDDVANAVGYDMSGGQVDNDTGDLAHPTSASDMVGLDITWAWNNSDADGVYRWHVTTLQGLVDSPANPTMVTNTWAHDITSATTANTITTTVTTAGTNTSTTDASGTLTTTVTTHGDTSDVVSNTTASGGVMTTVKAEGNVSTDTTAQNIFSTSHASWVGNTTIADISVNETEIGINQSTAQFFFNWAVNCYLFGNADVEIAGGPMVYGQFATVLLSEQAALAIVNLQQALVIANVSTGFVFDTHSGVHTDVHSGVHLDNHAGLHIDLHGGAHLSCDEGGYAKTITGAELHALLGTSFRTSTMKTEMTDTTYLNIASTMMNL